MVEKGGIFVNDFAGKYLYHVTDKDAAVDILKNGLCPMIGNRSQLAGEEDQKALRMAAFSGCQILATAHGQEYEDLFCRQDIRALWEEGIFSRCVLLEAQGMPGVVKAVFDQKKGCIYSKSNRSCLFV